MDKQGEIGVPGSSGRLKIGMLTGRISCEALREPVKAKGDPFLTTTANV